MYKLLALTLLFSLSASASAATVDRAFSTTVTQAGIQADYLSGEKIKVLVMPGHEPSYGGAIYKDLKERDIVVEISNALATELRADPRFEVTVARDTLSWNGALLEYFEEEWKGIQKFVKDKKREMQRHVRRGNIEERTFEVAHNTAATDVALRLYGISKWANENEYDIAIHVHLNDNLGHNLTSPGLHSGFAVYVPDPQYGNGEASAKLGEAIAFELNHFSATSTLPIENYGIVPDQELIALGAFNTAEFASVLVEYGYIYESKITYPESRPSVVKDFAHQTYRGIQKFVGATPSGSDTLALPYAWTVGPLTTGSASAQAYALQVALHKLGFYPPQGELLIGCPISGYVGECTVRALKNFQASKGLEQTGSIGPRTKAALQAAGF
jgi:N-acetylmuramoyl-L-alanine amidase